jgi:CBS domain containing-hemolysin-like protein/mannitol/fructose-specific phosphotransferase system IIA component (Ntr-type)
MVLLSYLLLTVLLLLLNAFFVLAEFASVKARPTLMEVLAAAGNGRARAMRSIQSHLDQFLSVCQIGITMASIGLGFVGEPAVARILKPAVHFLGFHESSGVAAHSIAIAAAYLAISYLHIVIGELVPKSLAIRKTEAAALATAYPMIGFYYLFIVPLWILNSSVNLLLHLLKIPPTGSEIRHSEEEIRLILKHSQSGGSMSFRRLLYMENVLDLGALTVRNAMRSREQTQCLYVNFTRNQIDGILSAFRYSRYPLIDPAVPNPLGYVHIKDLFLAQRSGKSQDDLRQFVRQAISVSLEDPLESLISEMQRTGNHVAFVYDRRSQWTGFITLEDAIEEVIGTVEEEFPIEAPVRLSDVLAPERIVLNAKGIDIISATRNALLAVAPGTMKIPVNKLMPAIIEREELGSSYVGKKLAIPHARLKGLVRPIVIVARLETPIPAPDPGETIEFLFILITPVNTPRIHQILLSHVAGMFESDFFEGRMREATSPVELYEAIRVTEQTALA